MNKKFTKIFTTALMLLMMITQAGTVWGQEISFDPKNDKSSELSLTKGAITITATDGTFNNGTDYRVYKNQTMTISTSVGNITNIALTYNSASYDGGGWSSSYQPNANTWTSPVANGEQARITLLVVTYSTGGSTDPSITVNPTTITWNDSPINVGLTETISVSQANLTEGITISSTIGTVTPSTIAAGEDATDVTFTYTPTSVGDFEGTITFTSGETTATVSVTGSAYDPSQVDTYTKVNSIADLTADDVFIIVGNNGSNYAMSNNNGTSSAPTAVAVTVTDDEITNPANTILWTISGNATDGYTFYPYGSTETWLYCTSSNNGIRVGTNTNKTFTIDQTSNYLQHNGTSRFLGIYSSQDWRCYETINSNIQNQTFAFYKKGGTPSTVATPTFTPAAGTYTEAQNVTIACATEGASIYYTLDGSTPTNASTLYTSAIAVSETTTVKAIAYVGEESSNVATAVYEIITIPTYTSLAELIAAGEPTATGVLVNVTLTDEEITRIFTTTQGYRNGIFLQSGEQEIEIYCYNVPTEWVVGGTVSGTLNNCTWKLYGNIWELCPENWNELTYTAPSTEFHLIEIDDTITNGSVSASAEEAQVGTIITLTVTPAENYSLDEIGVLGNTSEPELTKVNVNTYTFEMPDEDVIVFASFVENDTYIITYYYNGELYGEDIIEEGAIGALEIPSDDFLPEGFTFAGWSTSMASTTAITESYNVTANTDLFAIFARVEGGTTGSGNYEKVTSALTDWSGDYLIVYEGDDDHDAVAFDGSLETLDAVENGINVSIENGIIAANEELVNSEFTIAAIVEGYSIMNKSGDFIGRTSSGNGLNTSTTAIKNSLEISGNAMSISSGGCTLQYNYASNQLRFRYYTSSNQQPIQLYKKSAGTSGVTHYYTRVYDENTELSSLTVSGPSIVLSGYTLTVTGTMTNTNAANLVIEDGGQIIRSDEGTVNATFKKHIEGYTANQDNYYLIAAPIANASIEGLTTNSYDLYSYDEPTHYWFNQEGTNTFSSLSLGQGYLYANSTTGDVTISGTISNNQNPTIDVTASSDNLTGFNLVGNPFSYNLSISDMAMMDDDTEIYDITSIYQISGTAVVASQNTSVAPCEGFFIQAPVAGELYFNAGSSRSEKSSVSDLKVEVKESTRSAQLLDRAYVNFSESRPMNKFYLNENSTRLYIPQNGKDYAVVMANAANGEMPVNFKAAQNGTYTITVSTENVEANYLHLIDNLTGADIDLLTTDSYTFDATTRDYASRFKLVFGVNNSNAEVNGNSFAYISNGELIISNEGRATLQVIDMTGRIVSSQEIEGEGHISTEGMTAGVYVLNLNGTTQKIVVR